ncbi:ATP-binding protein [Streptomyces uncialis]|uniref:ATP-binding protein n=1 Tax=Streptomyces uncialis TaxID=1048205 RepID=UPI0037F50CFD
MPDAALSAVLADVPVRARRRAAVWTLPGRQAATPSTARQRMTDILARWGVPDGARYDAVLIVSELTTNVVRHSAADHMRVTVRLPDGGPLTVIVTDQGPPAKPAGRVNESAEEGGRGLGIVAGCSAAWLIRFPGQGFEVEATIAL